MLIHFCTWVQDFIFPISPNNVMQAVIYLKYNTIIHLSELPCYTGVYFYHKNKEIWIKL